MQINNTNYYLTDRQLADRYKVHRTTIWRWVRTGKFPQPEKLSDGCTRWADDAIAEHERRSSR
jgi:predicted DNA-binding transcriptional regulator AlpA